MKKINPPITRYYLKSRAFISKLHHWLNQTKISNIVIISCLAGFLLSCVLLWLISIQYQQQQATFIDDYGNALNKLATSQLNVSMSNNNLIGLQSILNDLIDQTKAINAVVYNVDNKIIVQAGEINGTEIETFKSYTSPITLDNVLLGSLTISIDARTDNNYWLSMALLLLLTVLLLLFLRTLHKTGTNNELGNTTQQILISDGKFTSKVIEPKHQAFLLLDFHTIDKLYQQLNADARENEFEKLNSATQKILTLYSGKKIAASTSAVLISFENKDQKDGLFNALCCAYLFKQTCLKQQWLLHFSSYIYDKEDHVTIKDFAQLRPLSHQGSEQGDCGIFIKQRAMRDNQLENRFTQTSSSESEYSNITGISKSYEKLIKSQLSHIL